MERWKIDKARIEYMLDGNLTCKKLAERYGKCHQYWSKVMMNKIYTVPHIGKGAEESTFVLLHKKTQRDSA
ncbi:MAG: hypothetical protein MK076_05905 [Flavobacteriales bacterium]|nr:hypothetical protein [Flavobacteriales bacterium]